MAEDERLSHLEAEWHSNPRWTGITRPYATQDVERLRGTVQIEQTLARQGAKRLWQLLHQEDCVTALGAVTGHQAVQQVSAGLPAIYVSGWQAAADANLSGQTYPDLSLYPSDSVPYLVRRINQALARADQIHHAEGKDEIQWYVPLIADAESGFGGPLNAFELMKSLIEAGAACVHFEDQLSPARKPGRMGGKALVPTMEAVQKLIAARLAADVLDVPTVLIGRTDADSSTLLTSDIDPRDHEFLAGKRTAEGLFRVRSGVKAAIARAIAYAPYVDIIWSEAIKPDLAEAREFAEAILAQFPGKLLAYNFPATPNWKKQFDEATMAGFRRELTAMGYKLQFITTAGFHALNLSMFELASGFKQESVAAYSRLQDRELQAEQQIGYQAAKQERFVGSGYFDAVLQAVSRAAATSKAGS